MISQIKKNIAGLHRVVLHPASLLAEKMPIYRVRIFTEYLDKERLKTGLLRKLNDISSDWFFSVEISKSHKEHLQGWIALEEAYDGRGNRKAKEILKTHIPFIPNVKFDNSVWSVLSTDMEKFESYQRYVAKEMTTWFFNEDFDEEKMKERHFDFYKEGTKSKKKVATQQKDQMLVLKDLVKQKIDEKVSQGFNVNRQDIIEETVRLNQDAFVVLSTKQLQWVILQLYAKTKTTSAEYFNIAVYSLNKSLDEDFNII